MAAIIQAKSCSSCAHSVKKSPTDKVFECRFSPPSVLPIIVAGPGGQPQVAGHVTSFPQVTADIYCAQHNPVSRATTLDLNAIVTGAPV